MKYLIIALFLVTFIKSDDDLYDETRIYNAIISLKTKYPQGYPWTNGNEYVWGASVAMGLGYFKFTGRGCVAFAMLASDAAFGNIPAYQFEDKSKIRVGDILTVSGGIHSVIVLKKNGDTQFTIAEGNFNSAINWERDIDINYTGFDFGITRYTN